VRAFAVAAGLALAVSAEAEKWKPHKPIELVIMAGTGGGADRPALLFQAMIQKEKLSTMPMLPVKKGGGSLKDKEGDNHRAWRR
jgi:tripartite-type tricarboxylate transporter receptor subunit TctC